MLFFTTHFKSAITLFLIKNWVLEKDNEIVENDRKVWKILGNINLLS